MKEDELRIYISWLKERARHLGTMPRRSVKKNIEVAEKIFNFSYPPATNELEVLPSRALRPAKRIWTWSEVTIVI